MSIHQVRPRRYDAEADDASDVPAIGSPTPSRSGRSGNRPRFAGDAWAEVPSLDDRGYDVPKTERRKLTSA